MISFWALALVKLKLRASRLFRFASSLVDLLLDVVWFIKCNINSNGNDSRSSTNDNKFK